MQDKTGNYYQIAGITGEFSARLVKSADSNILIKVKSPHIRYPFYLRHQTSDIPTFIQVFIKKDYDFLVEKCLQTIVDAGANIGLAAIYFANKYSEAQIFAVEPEASNYAMLQMNAAPYDNIIPLNAALWDENEEIIVVDPGHGKWGFMTEGKSGQEGHLGNICHTVKGMTVDRIMDDNGLEGIDILKIDIEGAEREVFRDPSAWLGKVDALIIELHERLKPGCSQSFYNELKGFAEYWTQGENIFLSRKQSITRPE